MKRSLLLIVSTIFYLSAFAGFGFYEDGGANQFQKVVFDFGSGNEWKSLVNDIEGQDYLTKNVTDTWVLKGGEAFVWQDGSNYIIGVTCHYRIYKDGTTPPSFRTIEYVYDSPVGGNNHRWENVGENINILDYVKETGTYHVEFYYSCLAEIKAIAYFSNGGNNFKLHFTSNIIESQANDDWANGSTWNGNVVPQTSNTVRVSNDVTVSTDAVSITSVNVNSGSLQINTSGELTVNAGSNISGGSMVVKSDASGAGSLINEGSTTGNIKFERFVTNELYHYVSSPVSGQTLDESWLRTNGIVNNPAYQMWRWDEDNNYWIIFGSTGNPEAFTDTEFVEARGYMIERIVNGSLLFTGEARTEDVLYPATYTAGQGEGFNMVGNPFTSSIAITEDAQAGDNFLADNAVVIDDSYEAIYIWDEQPGYSNGRNDYKVICNSGFTGTGSGTQLDQDQVGPGQGFIVKVVEDVGPLAFNTDTRQHASVDFYKSKESWPGVEVFATSENLQSSTVVTFHENMSNGLDVSYDAAKIKGNPKVALYTNLIESNGEDYAVQALPELGNEDVVVALGLDVIEDGVFEFTANPVDMDGYDIILEDRGENVFANLKTDTYLADVTIGEAGRFFLHFKASTGIEDGFAKNENLVKVYTQGNLVRLDAEQLVTNGTVSVFNPLGQKVKTFEFSGTEFRFYLEKPGAYIIKTQAGQSSQSHKILVY